MAIEQLIGTCIGIGLFGAILFVVFYWLANRRKNGGL